MIAHSSRKSQARPTPSAAPTVSLDKTPVSTDETLTRQFTDWLKKTSKKAVVLKRGEEHLIFPLHLGSRWFETGNKRRKGRILHGIDRSSKTGILLTLTVDPKDYETVQDATNSMWPRFAAFRDALNMRLVRSGKNRIRYIAALEFTKRGWPHLHLWLPGLRYLAPQRELQELWGSIVDVRFTQSGVAGYVLKYIMKASALPDSLKAVLWSGRIRSYSVSPFFRIKSQSYRPAGYNRLGFIECEFIATVERGFTFEKMARSRSSPGAVFTEYEHQKWTILELYDDAVHFVRTGERPAPIPSANSMSQGQGHDDQAEPENSQSSFQF